MSSRVTLILAGLFFYALPDRLNRQGIRSGLLQIQGLAQLVDFRLPDLLQARLLMLGLAGQIRFQFAFQLNQLFQQTVVAGGS